MLETFRKYTGLMFVVLILLFVGLVFFGSSGQGVFSGPKVVYAYGRGYTAQELNKFAEKPARMLKELSGEIYSPRYQAVEPFLSRMGVITYNRFRLTEDQITSFLVNRVALHRAMKEFGVTASTAEVDQFMEETVFWENGEFNEAAYDEFQKSIEGKLGMRVKHMNEIVGEMIALKKLEEIVGAGVESSHEAVLAQHLSNTQRISYRLVEFPLKDFEEKQMPTDEEIKAHWEPNKKKYQSKPKRRISYILAKPDYEALEKKLYPEAAKEETPKPEGTEAAEDPLKPETDAKPPGVSKLTEEDRKKAIIDLATRLDGMVDRLDDANGEGFEELVKELGTELKTTELVEQGGLPAELSGKLADEPNKTGADLVFAHTLGEKPVEPMHAFSEIKKLGTDQWLFFRLDEEVAPAELPFEEAKDKARSDLVKESSVKAMEETAKAKRTALEEALKGGKSIDAATKELELTMTSHKDATRPAGAASPELTAFNLCSKTNPGELSEVEVETSAEPAGANRALFTYVETRQVYENQNLDSLIARQVDQARDRNRTLALANWFAQQSAQADLKIPSRE